MKRWLLLPVWLILAGVLAASSLHGQSLLPGMGPADDFEAHADSMRALTRDQFELSGNVTFRSGGMLLQADRLVYDRVARTGQAEGNVLYAQGGGRLAGDRITFNVLKNTAVVINATGYLDQGIIFRAPLGGTAG